MPSQQINNLSSTQITPLNQAPYTLKQKTIESLPPNDQGFKCPMTNNPVGQPQKHSQKQV